MNYHRLLQQRAALLQQARLANLAFAHDQLGAFAARIARARLSGEVTLRLADPEHELAWPVLTARACSQAVLEEHFTDEDIVGLSDILRFLAEDDTLREFTFRLEELHLRFQPDLRRELEAHGIRLNLIPSNGVSP